MSWQGGGSGSVARCMTEEDLPVRILDGKRNYKDTTNSRLNATSEPQIARAWNENNDANVSMLKQKVTLNAGFLKYGFA